MLGGEELALVAVRGFLPCFVSSFLNFFFFLWEMTQALESLGNSAPNETPLGVRCLQAGDLRVQVQTHLPLPLPTPKQVA